MNKNRLYKVLLSPRVTEKTARLSADSNQYVFEVSSDANKADVRDAVEHLFEVNVENVRIVNVKGKTKAFRLRAGRRATRHADQSTLCRPPHGRHEDREGSP